MFCWSNFQLVVSLTCAQKQLKSIPNPQGKENPKGNLMRQNEIGNQVLIFSKIILNKFFVKHISSCDCFPFLLLPWRGVLMFFVFFLGALLVWISLGSFGRSRNGVTAETCNFFRDMQFFARPMISQLKHIRYMPSVVILVTIWKCLYFQNLNLNHIK